MQTLIHFLEICFRWLVEASIQASILTLLILLIQFSFRKYLSAKIRYGLWFLVLIRLAAPILPQSSFSLFNFTTHSPIPMESPSMVQFFNYFQKSSNPAFPPSNPQSVQTSELFRDPDLIFLQPPEKIQAIRSHPSSWDGFVGTTLLLDYGKTILLFIWLAGVGIYGGYFLLGTLWFSRKISRMAPVTQTPILEQLESCKKLLGVKTFLPVIETTAVKSPALMGLFRPKLLFPKGALEYFSTDELRYIFLHELTHLKRGDIAVNWFIHFLKILHWFNPILVLAFHRMKMDREFACDAEVLLKTGEKENGNYGQTILKLLDFTLDSTSRTPILPGAVGLLESKNQIKHRITSIARFTRKAQSWSPAGILLWAGLGALTLTNAKQTTPISSEFSILDPSPQDAGIQTMHFFQSPDQQAEENRISTSSEILHINREIQSLKTSIQENRAQNETETLHQQILLDTSAVVSSLQSHVREQSLSNEDILFFKSQISQLFENYRSLDALGKTTNPQQENAILIEKIQNIHSISQKKLIQKIETGLLELDQYEETLNANSVPSVLPVPFPDIFGTERRLSEITRKINQDLKEAPFVTQENRTDMTSLNRLKNIFQELKNTNLNHP